MIILLSSLVLSSFFLQIDTHRQYAILYLMNIASSKSTQISLAGIRIGRYALSAQRQNLLSRVKNTGDYVSLPLNTLEIIDLAYLSAATGDEFAILRSKRNDVLFHGSKLHCDFLGDIAEGLKTHRYELVAHSHPGEEFPSASIDDKFFLREIGQQNSKIISGRTGVIIDFDSA